VSPIYRKEEAGGRQRLNCLISFEQNSDRDYMRNSRRSDVASFIVMDVMEEARKLELSGKSIVHMEVGQPHMGAPRKAREALVRALDTENLGYTVALGLPALRVGIANLYRDWYGLELNPDRVIVTSGSSGAFLLAFTSLFDSGETVGVPEPGYPSYRQILKALGLTPVGLPTFNANRHIPILPNRKLNGLVLASPANPTGTILAKSALNSLIIECSERNISFISDEIYHGINYEQKVTSALEISDDVYVINSFSKYFSMTGWRVGWMVVPEMHIRKIERLAQNMFICASHAGQVAALGALSAKEDAERLKNLYKVNRDLIIKSLPYLGVKLAAPPDGGFYVYADISSKMVDSLELSRDILHKVGVAITPGVDFDPIRGNTTIRLSYAQDQNSIRDGLARLKKYFLLN